MLCSYIFLSFEFVFFFVENFLSVDVITAIEFDKSGNYLAVGDRGGRVVIFERKDANNVRVK